MSKINLAATGHGSKAETYADGTTIQFNVFPDATKTDKARLKNLQRAVKIVDGVDSRLALEGQCNKYFKALPKGKSFRELWRDDSIFLDFSPSSSSGFFGATHSNDKDVTITAWCLDTHNRWMVAATLVHEFAHVGGAPGGASKAAETAADKCYFHDQYDPSITGSIQDIESMLRRFAIV